MKLKLEKLIKSKPIGEYRTSQKHCVLPKAEGIAAANVNWKVSYPIQAPKGAYDFFESDLEEVLDIYVD